MTIVTKFAANWVKKAKRQSFWRPISSKIELAKEKKGEKEKARKKKGGEEKKAMVALLGFIMATLAGKKELFDGSDLSGGNFFKNPARHKLR